MATLCTLVTNRPEPESLQSNVVLCGMTIRTLFPEYGLRLGAQLDGREIFIVGAICRASVALAKLVRGRW